MASPGTQTAIQAGAVAGIHLPGLFQHVLDSLEAHLGAVLEHAKTGSPGATQVIADFGDEVLEKLDDWGVAFRGELLDYRAKLEALRGVAGVDSRVGSGSVLSQHASADAQAAIGLRTPGTLTGSGLASTAGAFANAPPASAPSDPENTK